MQLKEFSLISPVIESGVVFKALETAIPSAVVEQAIGDTHSNEERKRAIPITSGGLSNHCYELMVESLNENSPEKSGRWLERSLGESWAVLASTL